jgi:hypothetical protein
MAQRFIRVTSPDNGAALREAIESLGGEVLSVHVDIRDGSAVVEIDVPPGTTVYGSDGLPLWSDA